MNVPVSSDGVLKRAFCIAGVLSIAGLFSLAIDGPASTAGREFFARTSWKYVFWEWAELFGDGIGVILYTLVIFIAFRESRPYLPRVLICAFGAGLLADLIKVFVVRLRPRAFHLDGSAFDSILGFRPWLAMQDARFVWDSATQSFPSAHTATAFGFAVGLGWLFPRARLLFVALASLVACQRVVVGANFPSDVLVGAAVGCAFAACCLDRDVIAWRMDAWEATLRMGRWRAQEASGSACCVPIAEVEETLAVDSKLTRQQKLTGWKESRARSA